MHDTRSRSIIKALSWRVTATLTTFAIVWLLTGELLLALEAGAIEVVLKMMLYYVHERGWNLVKWGKTDDISS